MKQLNWAPLIAMQVRVTPGCVGDPGTVKSTTFERLALKVARWYTAYMLDQTLPEDIRGYPMLQDVKIAEKEYKAMVHVLEVEQLRARHEKTVMLLDEFNQCGHAVQGAAQELVRKPGKECWMAAAFNPPESATAGIELPPAVVNRMCIVDWEPPFDDFMEGMHNDTGEEDEIQFPEPEIPIVPPSWKTFRPKWSKLIAMFLDRRPELRQNLPKDPALHSKPWPSLRSWPNLSKCLAGAESVGASQDVMRKLMMGCVGEGASVELRAFIETQDLPHPETILANPTALMLPKRQDLAIAVASGLLGVVENNNTADRWEACCDCWENIFSQSKTVAMARFGKLLKIKPQGYSPRDRNGRFLEMHRLFVGEKAAPTGAAC